MNHQDRKSPREVARLGAVWSVSIKGSSGPPRSERMVDSVSPTVTASSDRGLSRVGPRHQHGAVGPPAFLTACGWYLFSQLQDLWLFLKVHRQVTADLAFRAPKSFAALIGQGEPSSSAAASRGSVCVLGGPGVGAASHGQTLRNRELGQLCQTQKWLKRYKTGMFANLANLANVFLQNRPLATGPRPSPV